MKIFFWLLVAANVIFFAVMKSGGDGQVAAPAPLHAEKITLLTASQPVAPAVLPASTPVATPVKAAEKSAACFEWGEFAGTDIDQAAGALKKLQLGDKLSRRESDPAIGYWVYIPPLRDKAAVSQKVAQLKARGVTEYFVVQDAGEWLNAISLGVFKNQDSAKNFLDGLRTKGIHSAQVGERSGKSRTVVFVLSGLDMQMSDKLTALQKNFAGSELKVVSCH